MLTLDKAERKYFQILSEKRKQIWDLRDDLGSAMKRLVLERGRIAYISVKIEALEEEKQKALAFKQERIRVLNDKATSSHDISLDSEVKSHEEAHDKTILSLIRQQEILREINCRIAVLSKKIEEISELIKDMEEEVDKIKMKKEEEIDRIRYLNTLQKLDRSLGRFKKEKNNSFVWPFLIGLAVAFVCSIVFEFLLLSLVLVFVCFATLILVNFEKIKKINEKISFLIEKMGHNQ